MNDLDLNLIKAFVHVADEKGFSMAAKRMFVEQSAVSKAIKRLEDKIGVTLFLRTKRRVELTTKGMSLLPLARQMLQASEDFVSHAVNKENELSGVLKFGATSPLSFLFLPDVILKLSSDYVHLWPQMFTGMADDLVERIKRRELEFAFLTYEGARLKELEYREIGFLKYKLVASTRIKAEALNYFVGSREVHDRELKFPTFDKLKKINKRMQVRYSANDMTAYKALILKGLGIGLLPEIDVQKEIAQKKLKIIHPEMDLSFPVYVAYHASFRLSLEGEKMVAGVKDQISHLASD